MGFAANAAQAYDKEAFGYAASHFLNPKDLPQEFASKPGMSVQVGDSGSSGSFACGSPMPDGKNVEMPRSALNAYGTYLVRKNDLGLSINVNQFRSNSAAEKAFAKVSKDIKKCDGNYSGSFSDPGGLVNPYQTIVTSGKIPGVTVTGVESIFTNQNSNNAAVGDQPAYLSDAFTIFTLLNDVIISTQTTTGTALNLTPKQKKALEQVANLMVTTWAS